MCVIVYLVHVIVFEFHTSYLFICFTWLFGSYNLQVLIYKILTYGMYFSIAIFKDWTIVLLSFTSFVIHLCPLVLPIFLSFSKY